MPFAILILTDGKAGDVIPCRGIAQSLADNFLEKSVRIEERVIEPDFLHSLPLPFMPVQKSERVRETGIAPFLRLSASVPATAPAVPLAADLIIASGRRAMPYLRLFRHVRDRVRDRAHDRIRGAGKTPFLVFLKDPKFHRSCADFLWTPTHDRLEGANVFSTLTSPHALTQARLQEARTSARKRFAEFPVCAGILLGGDTGKVRWTPDSSRRFADFLATLPQEETILATPSRRTPDCLMDALRDLAKVRPLWLWEGEGENSGGNPYAEILAHSRRLVVTGDSHNMVSECLSLSKPVCVYRPSGLSKKMLFFLDRLREEGAVAQAGETEPDAPDWTLPARPSRDATDEIAQAIFRLLPPRA